MVSGKNFCYASRAENYPVWSYHLGVHHSLDGDAAVALVRRMRRFFLSANYPHLQSMLFEGSSNNSVYDCFVSHRS